MRELDLVDFIDTKLKATTFTYKGGILDPDNIIWGESANSEDYDQESSYPRIECLIDEEASASFDEQDSHIQTIIFNFRGNIRRAQEAFTVIDFKDIYRFGKEIIQALFKINEDHTQGSTVCEGFIQVGPRYDLQLDKELSFDVSACSLDIEIQIGRRY